MNKKIKRTLFAVIPLVIIVSLYIMFGALPFLQSLSGESNEASKIISESNVEDPNYNVAFYSIIILVISMFVFFMKIFYSIFSLRDPKIELL
jgi:polyferredoxin